MDQKTLEEGGQNALNFKCTKILRGVDKPIACQTPEKTSEPLPTKSKERSNQLPKRNEDIADLFDHMSCSLRLLHLRKKSPTFQNVCAQVEVLAKRKLLYMHLAQIKYILPEAIHIDKVLVHDNKTLCMNPDLKITLTYEVVQGHSSESTYMALRQLFGLRLNDFFNSHPEGTGIPEAALPAPFQQKNHSLTCEDLPVDPSAIVSSSASNQNQQLLQECHPYPFKRHFSKNNVMAETEKTQCSANQAALSCYSSNCLGNEGCDSENKCTASCLQSDSMTNLDMERGQQKESCSMCLQPSAINTPARMICSPRSVDCGSYESPGVKIASSPDILMTETPAQSAPKRLVPGSDVKFQIMTMPISISCNKPAKRVLDFSCEEGGNDALDIHGDKLGSSSDAYVNILEASTGCTEVLNASSSVDLPQKVEESHNCSHESTNQTRGGSATWQQMSSSLLGLVDVIYSIFCSVKCSPITKEELVHKIAMNSLDIVEIREVEERIEFLEKMLPDWIYRKLVPSGDIMYCIKRVSDLDSIRSRLCSNISVSSRRIQNCLPSID